MYMSVLNRNGVNKKLLMLSILTPALTIFTTPVFADASPSPSPQVNVNVNVSASGGTDGISNINTNTNTNNNNVNVNVENKNIPAVVRTAAIPHKLPATGANPFELAAMFGALPIGMVLRKFKPQ